MSVAEAKPSKISSLPKKSLKIVLFGGKGSGKTSLLGALARVSKTNQNIRLVDKTGKLGELSGEDSNRSKQEVTPYPVKFELPKGNEERLIKDVIFFDCDGNKAEEYLEDHRSLIDENKNPLAYAILNADALILTLPASNYKQENQRDFDQFFGFLGILEKSRSQRGDVSGLPVYLVLTKCDLLAEGVPYHKWTDLKIEEKVKNIESEFQKFMRTVEAKRKLPFGKIDFDVCATAIQQPLEEFPQKIIDKPFQVAELFNNCVQKAVKYQNSRKQAQRKLNWTVAAVAGMVLVMALVAVMFFLTRTKPDVAGLDKKIGNYRAIHNENDPEFLNQADNHIKKLTLFKNNEFFGNISPENRSWVRNQIGRLEKFDEFQNELNDIIKNPKFGLPRNLNDEEKLLKMKQKLEETAPPKDIGVSVDKTKAVLLRRQLLTDLAAIENALKEIKGQYQTLLEEGKKLKRLPLEEAQNLARKLSKQANRLPNPESTLDGSTRIEYNSIYSYPTVDRLQRDWTDNYLPLVKNLARSS